MMRRAGVLLLLATATACVEEATAPGACPNFCPSGSIDIRDTVLDLVERDSAFRGYVQPYQGVLMAVADSPGVIDSRAIFRISATSPVPVPIDTTTFVIDSSRLRVVIVRRDTNATNLFLKVYPLPITIDSTTTFADVDPALSSRALDSVNVSTLLALPAVFDSTTKPEFGSDSTQDSIRTDGAGHTLQINRTTTDTVLKVFFDLDTLGVPFSRPDSGKAAFGVRVHADSRASVALGTLTGREPALKWFYHYEKADTATGGTDTVNTGISRSAVFHSFVFNPPNPPLDDNLAVGGAPSARSIVRIAFPELLRDSVDIVRATLVLVPTAPVRGYVRDSFSVVAQPVLTDLGSKSPISTSFAASATVHTASTDTVRLELAELLRSWATDTAAVTTLVLSQGNEASSYTEIRFYSSRSPTFRPALHVTYVKRFAFGGGP